MIPTDQNYILVDRMCAHIAPLLDDVVLVGGCTVGLLITDSLQMNIRVTDDVDLATEIMTLPNYYVFGERLRALGFSEDAEITCRWRKDELQLDVMPMSDNVLGFTNSWYPHAFKTAISIALPNGGNLRHINAPTFIATKIEAFLHRSHGDFSHHDMEDIITLVNGRIELADEIKASDPELKDYVQEELETFFGMSAFSDMIPGHLRPNENRTEIVMGRLRKIIGR